MLEWDGQFEYKATSGVGRLVPIEAVLAANPISRGVVNLSNRGVYLSLPY